MYRIETMLNYNKTLKDFSRKLRGNMTDAERLLWSKIRGKQLNGRQFYRQKPIGSYIVDFYCPKANLVIELDGGQHYSTTGKQKDTIRDDYLVQLDIKVLRFSDRDIFENMTSILEVVWSNLK
jgi:very-short-patch-repair endonuclease